MLTFLFMLMFAISKLTKNICTLCMPILKSDILLAVSIFQIANSGSLMMCFFLTTVLIPMQNDFSKLRE